MDFVNLNNSHIVLVNPQIPQNTGSIARLVACTGGTLHLIHPMGFSITESKVKRAGLDYWKHLTVFEYPSWEDFYQQRKSSHFFFFSTKATQLYSQIDFSTFIHNNEAVYLVFGSETKGLPSMIWENFPPHQFYTLPMRKHLVRSLNLSQAVSIVEYSYYTSLLTWIDNQPLPNANL